MKIKKKLKKIILLIQEKHRSKVYLKHLKINLINISLKNNNITKKMLIKVIYLKKLELKVKIKILAIKIQKI